jgi:hypothetical protein
MKDLRIPTMSPHPNWIWNFDSLLDNLRNLHEKWERSVNRFELRGYRLWVRGVLFGIEMGRNRIAEYRMGSREDLDLLLVEWERRSRKRLREVSEVTESTRGIDFGIRLVVGRARRYLQRPAPPDFRWPKSS